MKLQEEKKSLTELSPSLIFLVLNLIFLICYVPSLCSSQPPPQSRLTCLSTSHHCDRKLPEVPLLCSMRHMDTHARTQTHIQTHAYSLITPPYPIPPFLHLSASLLIDTHFINKKTESDGQSDVKGSRLWKWYRNRHSRGK